MQFTRFIALAASITTALSQSKGFNYGSTNPDGSARSQSDFSTLFTTAQNLVGTSGFTSARLYTMIQAGSARSAISAIPAAINTKTSLLLGLWASTDQAQFNNELAALSDAISRYGSAFADLVVGISVGSEDLYRISPTGIENMSGVGQDPATLVSYISQVRSLIASTVLSKKPIIHVDTYTAFINGSNAAVISAIDAIGMDAYPYYQDTVANGIENGKSLFFSAYDQTVAVAQGKPVWVTETGWPVSGPNFGNAVASTANAQTYWDQVGCSGLFGTVNTWWYTIFDGTPSPSFGIVGSQLSTQPLFDLTCPASSSTAAASTLATSVQSAPTSAVTVPPTATVAPTGVATAVTSNPIAPGGESVTSVASAQPTQAQTAPGGAVSQISDGQIQAPTGQPISQISDGQIQAPTGQPVSQISDGQVQAPAGAKTSTPVASATGKSCPAALSGNWEYPHLIVPVSKNAPSTAYGTQYFGTINSTVSTIFNFDIPASDAGKTCSLVFLFPTQDQLETSSFTFSGEGGIDVYELSSPATQQTTYSNAPAGIKVGSLPSVMPGNSYTVTSHECGAGQTVSFEFEATGSLALYYFQDYNPSPIGAYVTVC